MTRIALRRHSGLESLNIIRNTSFSFIISRKGDCYCKYIWKQNESSWGASCRCLPLPPPKNKGRPRNFAFKISQQKKDEFARGDNLGFTKEGGEYSKYDPDSATPPFGSRKP